MNQKEINPIKSHKFSLNTLLDKLPEKPNFTPFVESTRDGSYLVLDKKRLQALTPHPYHQDRGQYDYDRIIALGVKQLDKGAEVGFFVKNVNDPYLKYHPEKKDYQAPDAGMLFTQTVSLSEVDSTLKLALDIYLYNQGKDLSLQKAFPPSLNPDSSQATQRA